MNDLAQQAAADICLAVGVLVTFWVGSLTPFVIDKVRAIINRLERDD